MFDLVWTMQSRWILIHHQYVLKGFIFFSCSHLKLFIFLWFCFIFVFVVTINPISPDLTWQVKSSALEETVTLLFIHFMNIFYIYLENEISTFCRIQEAKKLLDTVIFYNAETNIICDQEADAITHVCCCSVCIPSN